MRFQSRSRTIALALWAILSGAVYAQVKVTGGASSSVVGACVANVDCALTADYTTIANFAINSTSGGRGITLGSAVGGAGVLIVGNDTGTQTTPSLDIHPMAANYINISELADKGFNWAISAQTDPTLFLHSHNQNVSQYLALKNDGTNSVFSTGVGVFAFDTGAGTDATLSQTVLSLAGVHSLSYNVSTGFVQLYDGFPGTNVAHTVVLGPDDNASASSAPMLLRGVRSTGTDNAGGKLTIAGGPAVGAGAPGDLDIQTAKDLPTGTTAQTLFDRNYFRGKAKALTESSATTFVSINDVTTLTYVGGELHYCIFATDATDVQTRCGDEDFAVVNKAGTLTCSTPNLLGTEATAITTGTLTNTFTFVANGTKCDFQANAVSSLTQTTLEIQYSVQLNGLGTVTP